MKKKIEKMKKSILLLALCMTLGLLSSCSNDVTLPKTGETGMLKLTIEGSSSTRASGTPDQNNENTITRVAVGLFDHTTHMTTSITEGNLTNNSITISNVPAGTKQDIVVVGNAPEKSFTGLTSLDAFRAKTLSLTQTVNNLPMSGENVTGTTITSSPTATASVTISRLVARIQLTNVSTNFSQTGAYSNASFRLDSVFVYNANSTSAVGILSTGTQLLTSNPLHGYGLNRISGLFDVMSQDVTSSPLTGNYYYYAFENYYPKGINDDTKTFATKLVLAGTFYPNKSDNTQSYHVYYPVVVNRSQTGTDINNSDVKNTGIQRNNIYSISAVITGIGVSDPTKFMEPANLSVSVTIAPWNLTISQVVNF